MKAFSQLFSDLETSNKTSDKMQALVDYFSVAESADKLWALALFTGKRPKRPINTAYLKQWAMEIAEIPEWLFLESYSNVGDLGETISLLLPPPTQTISKPLHQWMQEIIDLQSKTDDEKKAYVLQAWEGLEVQERLIFNKLIGGSFRMGVSNKLFTNALAKYTDKEPSELMHSLMGKWDIREVNFEDLIQGKYINADHSKPYPFCLAYGLDKELEELGKASDWQAEYKWDGIRGQLIKRGEEVFIWSRGEELVNAQFPELLTKMQSWKGSFVLDGEILAVKDGEVLNFNELQKRLNRKNISKKMLEEIPVSFFVYDLLEWNGEDYREKTLRERRDILEKLVRENPSNLIQLSEAIHFEQWKELHLIRANSREKNSEGLMLKNKQSTYHSGRKKGDWWKWKVDALTIDAVLIYAQKGSGRRSGHYTDFTFAIKNEDKLVTIAKAYSGLTNAEIVEVNKFIRNNSLEKFGPVRTVKPELVFELAFEGIGLSNRHKSGVALRFPRITRWRKDKTVQDIDTVESVKSLIS